MIELDGRGAPRPLGRLFAAVGVLAALLAGCSSGADPAPAAAPGAGDAFPVTIAHGQGTVTIPQRPQRVVVLGFADAQIARALDLPVVAATRNPSNPGGNWAGVTPPFPAGVTVLDPLTPNIEAIAAARPDLILMTTAQPTFAPRYAQISGIAPTVSYVNELLQDPGEDLVRIIGRATGRTTEADALIARSDNAIAAAATRLSGLRDKSYVFGQFAGGTNYVVVAQDGPTAQFFRRLGMRIAPGVATLPIAQAGITQLPVEQLSQLDTADVVFFGLGAPGAEQQFRAQPPAARLAVLGDGRFRALTTDESSLLLGPNPATTDAILALVEPTLASAVSPPS